MARVALKLSKLNAANVDGVVCIAKCFSACPEPISKVLSEASALDESFGKHVTVHATSLPAKRLVFSPITKHSEYDDNRSFSEAAATGIKRALSAGCKSPLLLLPDSNNDDQLLVTILGALEALYVPIQLREGVPERAVKAQTLHVASPKEGDIQTLLDLATVLEEARVIARDIGGGDPERMSPPNVEKYVREVFSDTPEIKLEVVNDENVLQSEYPLFAAVNRAASVIERHRGRVMYLRYEPKGPITRSLYLVGKGITYDTGGCDIKTDGHMLGMSRDKCGAAAVAGFMKAVARLKPQGLRVIGALAVTRNSVGENAYVSDEVITARSKARVRVINTDAEGRMVMADVLCKLKEEAVQFDNAQLITIATLTGHACLAVGPYSIAMDNSVARAAGNANILQQSGEPLADPFEISILRREDFENYSGVQEGDDVVQSKRLPSSRCARGHQGPAAFLIKASGLDKHGKDSAKPLKYTHLDIAGSAGDPPLEPTAAPILALYGAYLKAN